jgi:putative membrane protein
MNQFKISLSKFAAVASVLGLTACGGGQSQPNTPSSAQSSSDQYGSTMTQRNNGEGTQSSPSSQAPSTSGTDSPATQGNTGSGANNEYAGPNGTTGGAQSGSAYGQSGSSQSGSSQSSGTTGMTGTTNTLGSSMDTSSLNDAQVAAVVHALNLGEIQQAQVAVSKAKSPEVKRFAQHMLSDHRDMQSKDAALLSRLQITPSDNSVSNQLKTDAQNELSTLQSATGKDFDRDYIDAQVRAHNQALELIDRMMSSVKSPELRAQLQKARPKIEDHMREAERIQQALQQGTTSKQQSPSSTPTSP